ncbi:MAG TPA: hypothetical protein VFQ98_02555 [Gallionella sp.]|nr:hypothetical protein [Gallionella sp.]
MSKRKTTAEFISQAKAVHGDRYDYSETSYVSGKQKVKIICSEHGVFEQLPNNHLHGFGCLLCGLKNAGQYHKKDTDKFIAEARKVHGDRYDYSKTEYRGAREKLTIICPKHGAFEQTASVHLHHKGAGAGCERCSYEERGEASSMNIDTFISRAAEIHKGAYDYSLVRDTYQNLQSKVKIGCPVHGLFIQTAAGHLSGRGCKKCSLERLSASLVKTTDEFIRDAISIHGDKYDYSRVNYQGAFELVDIVCPLDGVFRQSPTSHLSGIGCPKCSRRRQGAPRNLTRALRGEFDDDKESYVYLVSFRLPITDKLLFKIGSGTGSRKKTVLNDIQRVGGAVESMELFPFSSTGEAIVFEHIAHDLVMDHQFIVPVEYKFHGHSEVFALCPDLDMVRNSETLKRFKSGDRWQITKRKRKRTESR